MTRRKQPPPPVDPDDFGFNVFGKSYRITTRELYKMAGLDPLTITLYLRCLRPFADRAGAVREASFYRFLKILEIAQSPGGGPRLDQATRHKLERSIEWLVQAKLITSYALANRNGRALQIRCVEVGRTTPKV